MKWSSILYFCFTLSWSEAIVDVCETPEGRLGSCISINECNEFRQAFQGRSIPQNVVSFLTKSRCGNDGQYPKVCCGHIPWDYKPVVNGQTISPAEVDPVVSEDSYLTSQDKCGKNTDSYRIIGGSIMDLDEFPWMALLGYHNTLVSSLLVYKCGGALINNRYVLTAAHCVTGADVTDLGGLRSVRLGEYDTQSEIDCLYGACADPVQEILVHSTYPNPGYYEWKTNRENDIALVRLAKRAKFTTFVQPICLVGNNNPLRVGSNFYVSGWGRTNYEITTMSLVKLKVRLPIFSKTECVEKFRRFNVILTENHLCAGGAAGKDACLGDSGGPLMRMSSSGKWESVGIISFGNNCGKEGWPGVFTSVPNYIDWIKNTMRSTNV